jgi:hypothetical protein
MRFRPLLLKLCKPLFLPAPKEETPQRLFQGHQKQTIPHMSVMIPSSNFVRKLFDRGAKCRRSCPTLMQVISDIPFCLGPGLMASQKVRPTALRRFFRTSTCLMYAFAPEKPPSLVGRNFCLAILRVFAKASGLEPQSFASTGSGLHLSSPLLTGNADGFYPCVLLGRSSTGWLHYSERNESPSRSIRRSGVVAPVS